MSSLFDKLTFARAQNLSRNNHLVVLHRLGGAAGASSAVVAVTTTPDNRNIERESREIDRRLRQARKHGNLPDVDWLFLRAFLGALENELDAVDAFLAAGGDRDRLVRWA